MITPRTSKIYVREGDYYVEPVEGSEVKLVPKKVYEFVKKKGVVKSNQLPPYLKKMMFRYIF